MPRSPERQAAPDNRGQLSDQASAFENQLQAIVGMGAVEADPQAQKEMIDATLSGPQFDALEPAEQEYLKNKFAVAAEAPKKTAPETRPAAGAPREREKRKEAKEKDKAKTWRFDNYEFKQDPETGAFLIFEKRSKYSQREGQYFPIKNPQQTSIDLPPGLAERLPQEPELGPEIIEFCEQLRRQLDMDGALPIHFDRPKKEGADRVPKWTPTYDGARQGVWVIKTGERTRESGAPKEVDPRELPPYLNQMAQEYWRLYDPIYEEERRKNPDVSARELNALVRRRIPENKWYFSKRHNPRWSDWEGRARQRLREDIITAELGKRKFEERAGEITPAAAQENAEREAPAEQPRSAAPEKTAPAADQWFETPAPPEQPPAAKEAPAESEPAPKEPERPADAEAERQETEQRDLELMGQSRPMFIDLLPVVAKIDGGREKEDMLAIVKHVTKTTRDMLLRRYARTNDVESHARILHPEFQGKLAIEIAKELRRQELSRQFFEKHSFLEEKGVEVGADNRIAFVLDKTGADSESEALNKTARQLVFDALYGEIQERDERPVGDETRLIGIVEEVLRRLKDRRGDIAEYDSVSGRISITDLEAFRQMIRSMVRTGKK